MSLKSNETSHKRSISIPNNALHSFLFKGIPLKINALSHPTLLRFNAQLEQFFRDAPKLRRCGFLDGLLSLGKRKGQTENVQVNRELVPVRRCFSWTGKAVCSELSVLLLFRRKNSMIIFYCHFNPQLICNHSNCQSMFTSHYQLCQFDVDLSPPDGMPLAAKVTF